MPRHGVTPSRGHPRSGREQRSDRSCGAPSLRLLWMALALALMDSLVLWTPAGAHPLPAQTYFSSFSRAVPQLWNTFGWWNLTCPVCKSLFTVIDFGLQVSAEAAAVQPPKESPGRGPEGVPDGTGWHPPAFPEFAPRQGHPWLPPL